MIPGANHAAGPSRSWHRRAEVARPLACLGGAPLLAARCSAAPPPREPPTGPAEQMIIRVFPGNEASVERAVTAVGGHVRLRLGIIHGFSASVPVSAVRALRRTH